jgi:hypothetical protein
MSAPRDTSPEAAERVRLILMSRTAEERLRMWSRMSVGARQLAEAGVRMALGPDASDRDVKREVFLRFYGRELGRERALAIFDAIETKRGARAT